MTVLVRPSRHADLDAICSIYGHEVRHGLASFEETAPDAATLGARRADILTMGLPHLVAERSGTVIGFAYAGSYRPRPAYRHTVESSVYVGREARGQGAGRALMDGVIAACEAGPWREMIAVIGNARNHGSIALHKALGFRMVGTLERVGFKHGQWVDTVLMQRSLAGHGENHLPVDNQPGPVSRL
ncbi:GNAT family N-acetyltransferase [Cognatishimia sp. F0-27]|uniref:GNAT family N-acetyltransferase n=1 Tax=Cognatishimia sp. F0-27 TaxID=2816855 RepID=UPI001D0CA406|nr:GNAT family N-acetyltransferase [Cognatishimia sp. F0-27]MCC1493796.1 N-acetyltransferase [Cognatishimia sp. F0-27]